MIELRFDLIIGNGKIIDGAGNPWYSGDMAVSDGKIARIGRLTGERAERTIDASGLIVAPGFVDAHSHADAVSIVFPELQSTVMQGITTVVAGMCGSSLAPVNPAYREEVERRVLDSLPQGIEFKITWSSFDNYLKKEETLKLGVNMAHMVGHGTVRVAGMGYDARAPTSDELYRMQQLTIEAMESGAYGISTGLIYPPGIFSNTDEIVELAKVVAKYGGVYASHIRGEGVSLLGAVEEAIAIGENAGTPVHIAHHKAASKEVWGKSVETLRIMEDARKRGVDVSFDQYPYPAGATSLVTLFPPWVHDGGMEKLLERLRDPETRNRIRRDIETGLEGWENFSKDVGWENVVVSHVRTEANKAVEGLNMTEITRMRGDPDEFTALYNLVLEEDGSPGMIIFSMNEDDIRRIMQSPLQMVGTDSLSASPTGPMSHGRPHPRHYGTYPRILGRYVKDGTLRIEESIRKMTSFPAQRFSLLDRGLIKPGMCADITIFNPETVIDKATFTSPHQFPVGIEYVIVNGNVTVEKGEFTGDLGGKTLRKRWP